MVASAQYQIIGSTAREIAVNVEAGILNGDLAPGSALPTVRELARALGKSPATVSSAYRTLRLRGLVVGDGRRGTHVASRPTSRPVATARTAPASTVLTDLTVGLADPKLLPALGPALARVAETPPAPIERYESGHDPLLEFARNWFTGDGIAGSSVAVAAGALDGLERVLAAHLRVGDRVLIEDPAYPPIRDVVLALGLESVPVALDERGLVPAALARALDTGARALVLVPRGQNPTGAALDRERAAELRAVLELDPNLLVVEDDHVSLVAGTPCFSLIAPTRRRWAVVRSLSKILHPDLRLALMAGDETTIARVEGRRALGQRWLSYILQGTASELLTDPGFAAHCANASAAYAERRAGLIGALARRGIAASAASGLNVWVPVTEEAATVRGLSEAGWLVVAGERFRIASPPGIRITIATLREREAEQLADALADVLQRSGRRRGSY